MGKHKTMKFSKVTQMAVKKYVDKAGVPKEFTDDDKTKFKFLLAYKFQMELHDIKKKNLPKADMAKLVELDVMSPSINNSVFKEVLNWAALKDVGSNLDEKAAKKAKKAAKKAGKHVVTVATAKKSKLQKFVDDVHNAVLDKLLGVSIWVNDILIGDIGAK